MSDVVTPLIVLTNDDGINSPGLLAAANALSPLGWVLVVAPHEQQSGSGRSISGNYDGVIYRMNKVILGRQWQVYSVRGSPARAVQCALLELSDRKPDLLVSGINYGENVGSGITISGTIGAALEGASFGIPSLAVSLEMDVSYHLSHSDEIDFSAATHFVNLFAKRMLGMSSRHISEDVDVLKVDVPSNATSQTPWRITRQSRQRYYAPVKRDDASSDDHDKLDYQRDICFETLEPDSDISVLVQERAVSVTPISLDMTSRVSLEGYGNRLRGTN